MYSPPRPKKMPKATRPLRATVTLDEVLNYRPGRPETATSSPLMDQILDAWFAVRPISTQALGHYLAIDGRKLLAAVELLTGRPYAEVREAWAHHHVARLKREHPRMTKDELARAVGYADYSALWRTENREKRKKEYHEMKRRREQLRHADWPEDWLDRLKAGKPIVGEGEENGTTN